MRMVVMFVLVLMLVLVVIERLLEFCFIIG